MEMLDSGEIVARHNTPFNNLSPASADEIEITGTQTVIHIENGKFHAYASGVDQVRAMLRTE